MVRSLPDRTFQPSGGPELRVRHAEAQLRRGARRKLGRRRRPGDLGAGAVDRANVTKLVLSCIEAKLFK